jgi:hypothetical protein
MKQLILAARRDAGSPVPEGWQDLVIKTPGVVELGRSERRLQVNAEESAIPILRQRFGAALIIEELTPRHPLTPGDKG